MKTFFSLLAYRFRQFVVKHTKGLVITGMVTLVATFVIAVICSMVMDYRTDLPNEEKYRTYENIVQQVSEMKVKDIKNVPLPEQTSVILDTDSIVISNGHSFYSVTGSFINNEIILTRESGQTTRLLSFVYSGIVCCITSSCIVIFLYWFFIQLFHFISLQSSTSNMTTKRRKKN